MEIKILEKLNRKFNLMEITKDEMKKVYGQLNKLIVKKEAFKNMHHLIANKVILLPNEPQYLKLTVLQKPAPLHIQVHKGKPEMNFTLFYSRTNNMPDHDDNNGEYYNVRLNKYNVNMINV